MCSILNVSHRWSHSTPSGTAGFTEQNMMFTCASWIKWFVISTSGTIFNFYVLQTSNKSELRPANLLKNALMNSSEWGRGFWLCIKKHPALVTLFPRRLFTIKHIVNAVTACCEDFTIASFLAFVWSLKSHFWINIGGAWAERAGNQHSWGWVTCQSCNLQTGLPPARLPLQAGKSARLLVKDI